MDADQYAEEYVGYLEDFTAKLTDVVDRSLEIGNPVIARLKMAAFFPPKLYVEAASVGFEMKLPHEAAIAILVIAEAIRFEKSKNRISLAFSPSTRKRHVEYKKMVQFVDFAFKPYANTKALSQFMKRLTEGLAAQE